MQQLIALDSDLVATLQSTLEANRLTMQRIETLLKGEQIFNMENGAAYLSVSEPTLNKYINRGEIKPAKYGNRNFVLRSDLDAFIARHRRK